MADSRHFAKIDLGYFDNPKINEFLDDRPRVPLLHLRAVLYCRQHLTDGVFPIKAVARLASATACGSQCEPHSESQCDLCAGINAGLFDRIDTRRASVHDYLEHQESAAQIEKRKDAGQKGAASRWGKSGDANRNADRIAVRNAGTNANRNAEKRREEKRSSSASIDAEFETWWANYPRKIGKVAARGAFKKALKKGTTLEVLTAAVDAQKAKLIKDGIDYCPHGATWLNGERWTDEAEQPATLTSVDPSNSFWMRRPFEEAANE